MVDAAQNDMLQTIRHVPHYPKCNVARRYIFAPANNEDASSYHEPS